MKQKMIVCDAAGVPVEIIDVDACDSRDHAPTLATKRLHLATGLAVYCDPCAAWVQEVYKVLGAHCHAEDLELPQPVRHKRAIDLHKEL